MLVLSFSFHVHPTQKLNLTSKEIHILLRKEIVFGALDYSNSHLHNENMTFIWNICEERECEIEFLTRNEPEMNICV